MMSDKIYLAYEYSEIDTLPPGVTAKQVFGKDVCYIRKEAILKFIYDMIDQLNDRHLLDAALHCALNGIIDILNEM